MSIFLFKDPEPVNKLTRKTLADLKPDDIAIVANDDTTDAYGATLKDIVLASGVSYDSDNYKGVFLPNSALPLNPNNKPIWGDVSNDTGSTQTYTNFLDSNEEPISLENGKSGKFSYDGTSWSFVDQNSGEINRLNNLIGQANSVVNLNASFTANELNALKVIKRVTITGITDYTAKYSIATLVGPGNTTYPGRIIIYKIIDTGNVSFIKALDTSKTVTTTKFTLDNLEFEILADWTGFEATDIILNEPANDNMVIAKSNYKAAPNYATISDLGDVQTQVNELTVTNNDVINKIESVVQSDIVEQWNPNIEGNTTIYGSAIITAWGLNIRPVKNLKGVRWSGTVSGATEVRVIITKNDRLGALLVDKRVAINEDISVLFDSPIGDGLTNLFCRFLFDGTARINQGNYPATVFTPANGFGITQYSTKADAIDTGDVLTGNDYRDLQMELLYDVEENTIKPESLPELPYTPTGGFTGNSKDLNNSLGVLSAVVDAGNTFNSNELNALKVIKRVTITGITDYTTKYGIAVLCGPGFTDQPGRIMIVKVADSGNVSSIKALDTSATVTLTKFKLDNLEFEILADWTGFEGAGIILNEAINNRMIIAKHNYKASSLLTVLSENKLKKNYRISPVGSSVTWGDGFLQSGALETLIPLLQINRTNFIGLDGLIGGTLLNSANDRMFFNKKAYKLEGVGKTIDFDITGDEISIVQGMARSNEAASEIEVYIDGLLYDTINNFNPDPIGHEQKSFTAVAGQKEFRLLMPFTFNHVVKVNGVEQTVILNKGTTMPSSGWAVARDIQLVDGKYIVQHTLFSPTALNEGDEVNCEFDYGHEIVYEKTTIGKDGNGIIESAYGRGVVPFDPANPGSAAFGSGLDFRETDNRVISKYVFISEKSRHVQLKIKGLDPRATGTGTPYFIFNFATSRILYFQNAGIGGWKSTYLNDPAGSTASVLRSWREVVDFEPDYIFYESTPNDDWSVGGYKLFTSKTGLSLAELQAIRLMPNKKIQYNAGSDTYDYDAWYGYIESITKESVTFTEETQIGTAPVEGDTVVIGTYFSDNKQYIARRVKAYNAASRTITFDRRISDNDHKLTSLNDFIGKRIQVRDLAAYINPTIELLDKFKSYGNSPKIGLVPNPAPNMYSRDLAAYYPLLNDIANERGNAFVGLKNVYDWQFSVPRNKTVTVSATDLVEQPDGTKTLDLTGFPKNNNYTNFAILIDGIDRNNDGAFVKSGYCLGVDRTKSGAALNDTTTRSGAQVWGNFYSTLIFYRDAPVDGDIVITCTDDLWSADFTHPNNNGKQLFALAYAKYID